MQTTPVPPARLTRFQPSSLFGFTLMVVLTGNLAAAPMGTAFSYQGRLRQSGGPADGPHDFQFSLWDAVSSGNLVGATQTVVNVTLSNGLFAAQLDFGPGLFSGSACWLEIGVRTNGGGLFTVLSPRQPLLPTPYSVMAHTASNLVGTLSAAQLSGTLPSSALAGFSGPVDLTNPANRFVGTFVGDGSGLTNLAGAAIQPGTVSSNALDVPTKAQLALAGTGSGNELTNLTASWGTNLLSRAFIAAAFPVVDDGYDAFYTNYFVQGGTGTNEVVNGIYTLSFRDPAPVYIWTNGNNCEMMLDLGGAWGGYNQTISNGVRLMFYNSSGVAPMWQQEGYLSNAASEYVVYSPMTNYPTVGVQLTGPLYVAGPIYGNLGSATNARPQYTNILDFPNTLIAEPEVGLRVFTNPPMGWNTYFDCGLSPSTLIITNFAKVFKTNGLLGAGYTLMQIDDGWSVGWGRNANHFITNHPGRFPAVNGTNGIRYLADTLHSWGFKLGLYYNSYIMDDGYPVEDAQLLADCDIDYIKLDASQIASNAWFEPFVQACDRLYRSNNRAPLFINGHVAEPESAPIIRMALNSRFATRDVPDGAWLADAMCYMTNADWYSRAVPCHQVVMSFAPEYAATNFSHRIQAVVGLNAMLGGEMVLNRLNDIDNPDTMGELTNVNRTIHILTNSAMLSLVNDPAQDVCRLVQSSLQSQMWVKRLGSRKQPREWAVAILNRNHTAGVTTNLTFYMHTLPQLQRPILVTEVWSGASWMGLDAVTATNMVNGECRIFRLTPHSLP